MSIQAIIWDCDGVLIDSELLACKVVADIYTRAGYHLTAPEYIRRFATSTRADVAAIIRCETALDIASTIDWSKEDPAREALFEAELRSVSGIDELLANFTALRVPMAVASGSSLKRLEHSLKLVRLWDHFAPHIYSTEQVECGKPSPDVYLLAAEKLNVASDRCVAIEDAVHGVRAGKDAGMTVLGFAGGSHCTPDRASSLEAAGADGVFADAQELQQALHGLLSDGVIDGLCSKSAGR